MLSIKQAICHVDVDLIHIAKVSTYCQVMEAKLIVVVFCLIVIKIDFSGASSFKRIENHLKILNAESRFIREEVGNIFEKIESFPEVCNMSLIDVKCQDQSINRDRRVLSKATLGTYKKADWRRSYIQLNTAFNKEKLLNTKIREQLPDLVKQMQTTEIAIDRVEENLAEVHEQMTEQLETAGKAITRVQENLAEVQKQITEQLIELIRLVKQQPGVKVEHKDQSREIADLKNKLQELNKTCIAKAEHSNAEDKHGNEVQNGHSSVGDKRPKSCVELLEYGHSTSGQYDVYLEGSTDPIRVYCDQDTLEGGWTVFQRRKDGSVDFYRDWRDYKNGFGDLDGEFWLGNEYLSLFTTSCCHQLRVELEDFEGETSYAMYEEFDVKPESEQYMLKVGRYNGTAGDALKHHNGMKFTTKDIDNDVATSVNCARSYAGAWWYRGCYYSHLNGQYLVKTQSTKGITWYHWKGFQTLKFTELKFR